MKIYKEIIIDLDAEREHVKRAFFTAKQKQLLTELYDLFEKGDFIGCMKLSKTWPRGQIEFVNENVWNVLWEIDLGEKYIKKL